METRPSDEKKSVQLLRDQPLDLRYQQGINPSSFKQVSVDEKSKSLYQKGNEGQRYAFVAWLKDGKWHMRIRPGYKNKESSEVLADAKERFGDDYVIADDVNVGIVHKYVDAQVSKEESSLTHADEHNPKIIKISGSFYKFANGEIAWTNRATANMNITVKNELALSCHGMEEFDLLRSLNEEAFRPFAETATKALGGLTASFDNCKSFATEKEWLEIIEMKEGPEKIEAIHDLLMDTIYRVAEFKPKDSSDNKMPIIERVFKVAQAEGIALNLEYISSFAKSNGNTSLLTAAQKGHDNIVKLLIDHSANVFVMNAAGETMPNDVIQYYQEKHHYYPEKILNEIKGKLDSKLEVAVDQADEHGLTPLFLAVKEKNKPMIEALLTASSQPNQACHGITPLMYAIKQNDTKTIDLLLNAKADPTIAHLQGMSPLILAIKNKNTDIVKKLIEFKADLTEPDRTGKTAFDHAYQAGDKEIITYIDSLLPSMLDEKKSDLRIDLSTAIMQRNSLMVYNLLNMKADPHTSPFGDRPILTAVLLRSNLSIIQLLLSHNAGANTCERLSGDSLLHLAVRQENESLIKLLLEYKARLTLTNHAAETPLHHAVASGKMGIIKLLANSSTIMLPDNNGATPLLLALRSSNPDIIRLLMTVKYKEEPSDHYKELINLRNNLNKLIDKFSNNADSKEKNRILKSLHNSLENTYQDFVGAKDSKDEFTALEKLKSTLSGIQKDEVAQRFKYINKKPPGLFSQSIADISLAKALEDCMETKPVTITQSKGQTS